MSDERKIMLAEKDMPKHWYNVVSDMPNPPAPVLHPGTNQPIGPDDLAPLFPMAIIGQEVSTEALIAIPEPVLELYRLYRPTPLIRATNLERALGTPAKIFYKYEGVSPAGSHKPNTAIAQAYYNKQEGVRRLATETGAGQWGSALSFACSQFDLECTVYMVKVSYNQKPYRRSLIETWGATVHPSPTSLTNAGRGILAADPDSPGSLGIAISEAVEDAATHEDTKYALGSVLNHVLLHQTIIGQEAKLQMASIGESPNVIIASCGGGSNFGGISFPFVPNKMAGEDLRFVAVEPTSCPTLTKGEFRYDFGDTAELTPLVQMYTLGHEFVPPSIHAGGLRYHGDSPLVSQLVHEGIMEAAAYNQVEIFEAAIKFARTEGIVPAPESAHAIKHAIVEAERAKEEGKQKNILISLSGHGNFDMGAYDAYFSGQLTAE